MIYAVECNFADPASEAEWNHFYSLQKLPALISVRGFHTSQRFRACGPGCPAYLALHTIDGLEVLLGEEYARKGGGNFARWQRHITQWRRTLYDSPARAPAIESGGYLLVSHAGPGPLTAMGITSQALHAVALDRMPARLWLASVAQAGAPGVDTLPEGVHAYVPLTGQLNSPQGAARRALEPR